MKKQLLLAALVALSLAACGKKEEPAMSAPEAMPAASASAAMSATSEAMPAASASDAMSASASK